MANRVLLNAGGFKVSKPGVDVLSASPLQLQFSSDWSQLAPYVGGEFDCDWNENGFRSFPFGKTFPAPPLVHMQRVVGGGVEELSPLGSFNWYWEYSYTDLGGSRHTAYHLVVAETSTTALLVHSTRISTSTVFNPSFRLRYTVMDYNL